MTNDEGQLPNDAGEQSREAAAVPVQPTPPTTRAVMGTESDSEAEVDRPLVRPAKPAKPRKRSEASENPDKPNNVRRIRIELMLSKAEVARRANISVLTLDRVERGFGCRVDTKRKILEALGLTLADRVRVFGEEE